MKKLFEIFAGAVLLALIIATCVNREYLVLFSFGLTCTIVLIMFNYHSRFDFVRLSIPVSVISACVMFLVWIFANLTSHPAGPTFALAMIFGALFPSMTAIASLESGD